MLKKLLSFIREFPRFLSNNFAEYKNGNHERKTLSRKTKILWVAVLAVLIVCAGGFLFSAPDQDDAVPATIIAPEKVALADSFADRVVFVCDIAECSIDYEHHHEVCSAAGCALKINHEHDGYMYYGHYDGDGHAYHTCGVIGCAQSEKHIHTICDIPGCVQMLNHEHAGVYYYGHYNGDGHAYHACGFTGCTQVETHKHEVCPYEECTRTDNHSHEGILYFGHHDNDGHSYHNKKENNRDRDPRNENGKRKNIKDNIKNKIKERLNEKNR